MDNLKKHTITCLILIFLVAQGMETIHFYLFHQNIEVLTSTDTRIAFSKSELHQCDFHYFKTPLSLSSFIIQDNKVSFYPNSYNSFTYNNITVRKFKQTKFLRGPPQVLI